MSLEWSLVLYSTRDRLLDTPVDSGPSGVSYMIRFKLCKDLSVVDKLSAKYNVNRLVSVDKLSLFDEDLPPFEAGLLQGGLDGGRGIKARGLPVRLRVRAWWGDVGT